MKVSSKLFLSFVITVLACALFPSSAWSNGEGQLTIKRSAHFGTNLFLDIWIDGKRVQRLAKGQTYNGPVRAGTHEVRVATSSRSAQAAAQVTVESGKSYQLTASWSGQELVLW
jgi:hypothetical protein